MSGLYFCTRSGSSFGKVVGIDFQDKSGWGFGIGPGLNFEIGVWILNKVSV